MGIEDLVAINLVYHQANDGTLRLAWNFTIHTSSHDAIWSVRIDALTGKMLEKNNQVISCSFDHNKSYKAENTVSSVVSNVAYKQIFSPVAPQVQNGSYRVIPFNATSPDHSSFQLITNPSNPKASPHGWQDINGTAGV